MKPKTIAHFTLLALAALLASSCRTHDGNRSWERRQIILPSGQVHEGWYFGAGDRVTIDGTVNGDAYVAGAIVEVTGTINGDLIAAGGQVTITGTVTDDIRAAGGSVRLSGHTGKNVTVGGGAVVISKEAEIGKNLLAGGGDLQIRGTVGEETKLAAGAISISGTMKGNVEAGADEFSTTPGASIGCDLKVATKDSTRVNIAQGTVHGKTEILLPEARMRGHALGMHWGNLWFKLLFTLSLLLTALILTFLLPNQLMSIGTTIMGRPGASALWGLLVIILGPLAVLILCVTLVGLPLGLLLLCVYFWYLYLSQLALGTVLGYKLFGFDGRHGWRLFGPVALGIVIVQILASIPYLCILIVLAGMLFGVGALTLITKEEYELHHVR